MNTSARTKARPSITKAEVRQALKQLLPFSVAKIGENIFETVITVIILGLSLAWLSALAAQPVTWPEMIAYIITGFVLQLFLRIVHDFDEQMQPHEIREELAVIKEIVNESRLIAKHESTIDEAMLNNRLDAIE